MSNNDDKDPFGTHLRKLKHAAERSVASGVSERTSFRGLLAMADNLMRDLEGGNFGSKPGMQFLLNRCS